MPAGDLFEKIEKLKMVHRILIFGGTIVLLAGLFAWLVYVPKTNEISRLSKEIAGLEQKISQAKIKIRSLKKFEKEYLRQLC